MGLYDEVVEVAKPYLGPAAGKFISRQIKGHLGIEDAQLEPQHLEELAKWVKSSGGMLMDDAKAGELANKVAHLK